MGEINKSYYGIEYREALLSATNTLSRFSEELYTRLFLITMSGEMKEWSDTVPNGETHTIHNELFAACDDQNVIRLLELAEYVDLAYESFMNINAITEAEREEYLKTCYYTMEEDETEFECDFEIKPKKDNESDEDEDLPF